MFKNFGVFGVVFSFLAGKRPKSFLVDVVTERTCASEDVLGS
jgi:hypothetical protein